MLRGVPVLASDVGGLPEAKHGVDYVLPVEPATRVNAKYVFPPQDMKPWVGALSEITDDARAYEECSDASRTAALNFISSIGAGAFERYFDEIRMS
jgi:glycosyltransferase involved in cell wall biosynthesis